MYPFLLPLFPILYFYTENVDRMSASEMIVPALASLIFVAILQSISYLALRDKVKTSLLSFCALLVFGSFTTLAKLTIPLKLTRESRDLLILGVMALVIVLVAFIIRRIKFNLAPLSKFLSVSTLAIVCVQGAFAFQQTIGSESPTSARIEAIPSSSIINSRPNIYYIILDAFGRADLIQEIYKQDSSEFLAQMKELGFFVAPQSHTNYPSTVFSISSTLNMTYLDDVAKAAGLRSKDRAPVKGLIRENSVVATLKENGYQIYFLPSGYSGVDLAQADERVTSPFLLNEFQNLLINRSIIPAVLRQMPWNEVKNWQYGAHRQRVKYIFDKLPEIADQAPSPKFIFAHIITPHPPFVFNADGSEQNPKVSFSFDDGSHFTRGEKRRAEYIRGYAQQVQHAQKRLTECVAKIIERDPGAIIIAQGDHGPGSHLNWKNLERTDLRERFSIFNAYRFPPDLAAKLYPEISPVNSFRLIFGKELLPDRSFFFYWAKPYEFIEVTSSLKK